jgi:uncharacterized protein with HEPN domain
MNEKAKKSLLDILAAISEIEEFISQVDGIEGYKQNLLVRRGTERMLGIIGEASTRFEREVEESILSNNRQIRGLRNRLVHVYDDIDNETIWGVIVAHLPALAQEVKEILSNEP